MNKHYRVYWEKLLETVAFSYGKVSLYELVQKEHKHFHPSGDPKPSKYDIELTKQIDEGCRIMDLSLADHIIIGDHDRYYSFLEHDLMSGSGLIKRAARGRGFVCRLSNSKVIGGKSRFTRGYL